MTAAQHAVIHDTTGLRICSFEYWLSVVNISQGGSQEDREAIALRLADLSAEGVTSCVWHEAHHYFREKHPKPPCGICGAATGRLNDGGDHCLCEAREQHGLATPPLPEGENDLCQCAKCRGDRGLS